MRWKAYLFLKWRKMRKWKQKHLWIKISSTTDISFELETFEKDLFNIVDQSNFLITRIISNKRLTKILLKSLLNNVGGVVSVSLWVAWVAWMRGFVDGVGNILALMAWVAWVNLISAWVAWVAWVHKSLVWVKSWHGSKNRCWLKFWREWKQSFNTVFYRIWLNCTNRIQQALEAFFVIVNLFRAPFIQMKLTCLSIFSDLFSSLFSFLSLF